MQQYRAILTLLSQWVLLGNCLWVSRFLEEPGARQSFLQSLMHTNRELNTEKLLSFLTHSDSKKDEIETENYWIIIGGEFAVS